MAEISKYDKQAADFCAATGLTIKKEYTGHRPYFAGEKDSRAVWSITFERPGRKPYTFTYGDSIKNSYYPERVGRALHPLANKPRHPEPSDYSVLTCIEKRGSLSFQDFCDNYGYDSDSIKARDIWIACNEQAAAIESMFSQEEIEQLEEIQ